MLFLIKILVTLVVVVGLSWIAERAGPKVAGVLAGYPHGIAIVLYFIGVEQGVGFAADAALFAMGGLAGNVVLAYVYARLAHAQTPGNVVLALLGSVAAFLAVALALRPLELNAWAASAVTLGAVVLVSALMRRVAQGGIARKPRIGMKEVVIRAALAAAIVLTLTGLAHVVGPVWAGLLAGFPVASMPLFLIIHLEYGPAAVGAVIGAYPFGLVCLLVYTGTVAWSFAAFGMGLGTAVGFVAATVYLLALMAVSGFRTRRRGA
ncbi:MAG: hypothetical protein CSA70_10910 [Rhodobacterales bacterium]|nr:MAG: hypothetical protein CSA70_10910 [Rhodobacterales bacterium]